MTTQKYFEIVLDFKRTLKKPIPGILKFSSIRYFGDYI
jgi:hypothetical protein